MDSKYFKKAQGINDFDGPVEEFPVPVVLHNFDELGHAGFWTAPNEELKERIESKEVYHCEVGNPIVDDVPTREGKLERMKDIDVKRTCGKLTDVRVVDNSIVGMYVPCGDMEDVIRVELAKVRPNLVFGIRGLVSNTPHTGAGGYQNVELRGLITCDIVGIGGIRPAQMGLQ